MSTCVVERRGLSGVVAVAAPERVSICFGGFAASTGCAVVSRFGLSEPSTVASLFCAIGAALAEASVAGSALGLGDELLCRESDFALCAEAFLLPRVPVLRVTFFAVSPSVLLEAVLAETSFDALSGVLTDVLTDALSDTFCLALAGFSVASLVAEWLSLDASTAEALLESVVLSSVPWL